MHSIKYLFLIALFFGLNLYVAHGGNVTLYEIEELSPSDGNEGDSYGRSVDVDGDLMVIGAPNNDSVGNDCGAFYIRRWNGTIWVDEGIVTVSGLASQSYFGQSIAIDNNIIVVGAPGNDKNGVKSGSVFIFEWDGSNCNQVAELFPLDAGVNDAFGYSVCIDNDRVGIGARVPQGVYDKLDSAYVFKYNGLSWIQEGKLTASDGVALDGYGGSISIHGNRAVVGAFDHKNGDFYTGTTYVYEFNGSSWVETAEVYPLDANSGGFFGGCVDLHGDTIIAGATYGSDSMIQGGNSGGLAYIFKYQGGNWVEVDRLAAFQGHQGAWFGSHVAIDNNLAVVGAAGLDHHGWEQGSVFVFKYNGTDWDPEAQLFGHEDNDRMGTSVSFDGNTIVAGASYEDAGFTYVFNRSESSIDISELYKSNDIIAGVKYTNDAANTISSVSITSDLDNKFDITQDSYGDWFLTVENGAVFDKSKKAAHSVSIQITNSASGIESKTFTIQLQDPAGVVSANDTYDISNEDQLLVVDANSGLLSNDQLYDASYTASVLNPPSIGSLNLNTDGSFTYMPEQDYYGEINFTYRALTDLENFSDSEVSILISPVNDLPTDIRLRKLSEFKIDNVNIVPEDNVGEKVAMHGDWAVSGTVQADGATANSGAAYVYHKLGDNWVEVQKLTASDGAADDLFGRSVSIHNDLLVVGASSHDANGVSGAGAVYVYRYNGSSWVEEQKLTIYISPFAFGSKYFGSSVSISGDTIIAGDAPISGSGIAYVFQYNGTTWEEVQQLVSGESSSGGFGLKFARTISMDADRVVIGASEVRSAFIFTYDGSSWVNQQKITAPTGPGLYFGNNGATADISGDLAVISVPSDPAVYVFEYNGADWQQKYAISSPEDYDVSFAESVALSDGSILVGASGFGQGYTSYGCAYLYNKVGEAWVLESKFQGSDTAYQDSFAYAVSMHQDEILITAPYDDDDGINSGSLYTFNVSEFNSMPEDIVVGQFEASILSTDIDSTNHSYRILNVSDSIFEVSGNKLTLKSSASINYEFNTTHSLLVEVNDNDGGIYVKEFTIEIEDVLTDDNSSYANYLAARDLAFNPGESGSGMFDDWDGDGILNLMEYSFGTNPKFRDDSNSPLPVIEPVATDTYRFECIKNKDFSGAYLSYEISSDLLNWSTAVEGVNYIQQISDNGNGTETVQIDFDAAGLDAFFVRLVVEAN